MVDILLRLPPSVFPLFVCGARVRVCVWEREKEWSLCIFECVEWQDDCVCSEDVYVCVRFCCWGKGKRGRKCIIFSSHPSSFHSVCTTFLSGKLLSMTVPNSTLLAIIGLEQNTLSIKFTLSVWSARPPPTHLPTHTPTSMTLWHSAWHTVVRLNYFIDVQWFYMASERQVDISSKLLRKRLKRILCLDITQVDVVCQGCRSSHPGTWTVK